MKKIFFACAIALTAIAFASCDTQKEQCWKMTVVSSLGTVTYYYYGSGPDSDAQLDIYKNTPGVTSVRKEQTFLSKDNCHQ
jgi:hypothetical protein